MGDILSNKDFITVAAIVAAGVYVWPKIKPVLFPTTPGQTENIFQAMNVETTQANNSVYATYEQFGQSTTYQFKAGDWDRLNIAQKFLLSLKIIPVRWVLG